MFNKRVSGAVALVAVLGAGLASAGPAAAELTVGSGGCTLPTAIEAANAETSGACGTVEAGRTTIVVPAGHYTLTGAELTVEADMALDGADPSNPGATVIDGNGASRVFEVEPGTELVLDALEVTGGATLHGADSNVPEGFGGVAENGGGILNFGDLTLEHVLLTGNHTGRGGDGGNGALTNTYGRNGGQASNGGNGGGIDNEGGASLVVRDSTISHNLTGEGGAGGDGSHGQDPAPGNIPAGGAGGHGGRSGDGGGIYNAGSATIVDSTVSDNQTGRDGPGGFGGEGADANSEFGAGTGGYGGDGGNSGLLYSEGADTPRYVEYGGGGGIDNLGALTMSDSTIADNNTGAGGLGGGAGIGGEQSAPFHGPDTGGKAGVGGGAGLGGGLLSIGTSASLTNVTITGNFTGDGGNGGNGAQSNSRGGGAGGWGGYGGGISAYGPGHAGLQLTFVTIAGNSVGAEGHGGADNEFPGYHGGPGAGGGIATGPSNGSGGGVTVTDSIVAGNAGANCNQFASGGIVDGGHDVSYADTTCPGVNADPKLGSLGKNGGATETMLPGTGSSAIELVPSGSCSPFVDQRGDSRPGNGKSGCDAGAVETGGTGGGTTSTITSLSSSANPSKAGASVTFTATVSPSPGGGTVAFADNGSTISGCVARPVIGGTATCSETFAAAGSHSIAAEYSGTSGFKSSTAVPLTQVVQSASSGGGGGGPGTGTGGGGSTPVTSPIPGSGPTGTGPVAKASVGTPKLKGTTISVPITCSGPADVTCVVKLLLTAPGDGRGTGPAKAKKPLAFGAASAKVPGGQTKTVTISLNALAKKELAKSHSLKATLTVSGSASDFTRTFTFK